MNDRWNIAAIAAYFGVKPKTVRVAYTKRPDFPKPVVNLSQKTRLWLAAEVMTWAKGRS